MLDYIYIFIVFDSKAVAVPVSCLVGFGPFSGWFLPWIQDMVKSQEQCAIEEWKFSCWERYVKNETGYDDQLEV